MSEERTLTAARKGAVLIKWGFEKYRSRFRRITRQSNRHFENGDWPGVQRDAQERLVLYAGVVSRVVRALLEVLGEHARSEAVWPPLKDGFSRLVAGHGDLELAETFFNSVTRKVFTTVGVAPGREYVHLGGDRGEPPAGAVPVRTYPGALSTDSVVRQILDDYTLGVPWGDESGDAARLAGAIDEATRAAFGGAPFDYIELLDPVFFRNKAAYLVGRVVADRAFLPLVVALLNEGGRIRVDAALLTEDEVSVVFSFTRAYFHVDVEAPAGVIRFLKAIMPKKPVSELYISLGYNKHGKTELYRDLVRHIDSSGDRFVSARGDKGMVMLVFTMPSYDVVFKVIKDRFGPTKSVTREGVRQKYELVFRHDRAGRLVDVQEFEYLAFARERFAPALLEELLTEASQTVALEGESVVIRQLYTERRLVPLNLFIREAPGLEVQAAVLDLGEALRDLAATNIFPGDLLLKNFGVTRHGRVVFYDYDELCHVTDCEFRALPEDGGACGTEGDGPAFYVGPKDIFPEELVGFMGFPAPLRKLFLEAHGDLLEPAYWNRMKARHRQGEILDVFPYSPARRLRAR